MRKKCFPKNYDTKKISDIRQNNCNLFVVCKFYDSVALLWGKNAVKKCHLLWTCYDEWKLLVFWHFFSVRFVKAPYHLSQLGLWGKTISSQKCFIWMYCRILRKMFQTIVWKEANTLVEVAFYSSGITF